LYATTSIDESENEVTIKIVNASEKQQNHTISIKGIKSIAEKGKLFVLKSDQLYSVNSFLNLKNIAPQESEIDLKGKKIQLNLSPYSFSVLRIKIK
jgi:alpha-L-arabinofuranosidase